MEPSAASSLAFTDLVDPVGVALLALGVVCLLGAILFFSVSLRRLHEATRLLSSRRKPSHGRRHALENAPPAVPASRLQVDRQREAALRQAVAGGELELLYQPEGSFGTLDVPVTEALLRWRLPDGRYWAPGEFLSVAEQSGLITQISDWVLRKAVTTAARWHHGSWPSARIAVNVSSRQLLDDSFAAKVSSLLHELQAPPQCLEIELTENVVQTAPATVRSLRQLRDIGVSIALDDFGTGYSSLASLQQLPLTRVKIDRSLVASVDTSASSAAIVRSIMSLCRDLGLQVTAEGVERPAQLAQLLTTAEVHVQGFLLARPMGEADMERFVPNAHEHMQELLLQAFDHLGPPDRQVLDRNEATAQTLGFRP